MNSNDISSNISPLEMAEMNNEDAKKIDVALGIIMNDMSSTIATIKNLLGEVETKINSLQTRKLLFNINKEEMENLTEIYNAFGQEVINFAGYYELEIVNIINIFDRMNSLDGSSTVDNSFFNKLPVLGTIMFTLLSYYEKKIKIPTQLGLDIAGNVLDADKDFNETFGNLLYNSVEYIGEIRKWQDLATTGLASGALVAFEAIYGNLNATDSSQRYIININAGSNGVKLILGNMAAESIALPIAESIGGLAGGAVGFVVIAASSKVIDLLVDSVVDELTGEAFIPGTSIPKNGGTMSLYSDYVKAIDTNDYSYGSIGRMTSLNGMTVSAEYCQGMAQLDPVGTLLGLDDFSYVEGSTWSHTLDNYLTDLRNISPDSPNFNEQVDIVTSNAMNEFGGSGDYVITLVNDIGFNPYEYASINN